MTRLVNILKLFNQKLLTGFAKAYQEHDPALKSLAYTVESEGSASVKYLFYQFISGMKLFTGNRVYDNFPDVYNFVLANKKFDKGLQIDVDDFEEGVKIGQNGQIQGADVYSASVKSLMSLAMDHPYELMITLMENGTSTTPLSTEGVADTITALDGQALFATTHDYAAASGSQSNIVTGTGTTIAQIEADLLTVISRFGGFVYNQNGTINSKKRKLNKKVTKINIHCPVQLEGKFIKLKNTFSIAVTGDNVVSGYINDIISQPFDDANDYYVELVDKETEFMRPFLNQIRKRPKLDMAKETDESVKQNDAYQYGVRYKGIVGIGAWWKLIKVTNP